MERLPECAHENRSERIKSTAEGLVRVTLGPCCGLSGSILCRQVRIESVVPWRYSPPRSPG